MMLISLPAGALADIYERRNIMLIAQSAMLVVATVLTGLTFAAITTPFVLLAATFLIAAGTALNAPSWQASMYDQVPREALESAASLNSMGFNMARSLGPATGGLLVAIFGVAAAFAVNAASYIGRSEEHTSELQSLMRISYAVFCLKKKKNNTTKRCTNHLYT